MQWKNCTKIVMQLHCNTVPKMLGIASKNIEGIVWCSTYSVYSENQSCGNHLI